MVVLVAATVKNAGLARAAIGARCDVFTLIRWDAGSPTRAFHARRLPGWADRRWLETSHDRPIAIEPSDAVAQAAVWRSGVELGRADRLQARLIANGVGRGLGKPCASAAVVLQFAVRWCAALGRSHHRPGARGRGCGRCGSRARSRRGRHTGTRRRAGLRASRRARSGRGSSGATGTDGGAARERERGEDADHQTKKAMVKFHRSRSYTEHAPCMSRVPSCGAVVNIQPGPRPLGSRRAAPNAPTNLTR